MKMTSYGKGLIERTHAEAELRKQWRTEMEQNEALQNYFKQFDTESINSFIDTYLAINIYGLH